MQADMQSEAARSFIFMALLWRRSHLARSWHRLGSFQLWQVGLVLQAYVHKICQARVLSCRICHLFLCRVSHVSRLLHA